VEWRERFGLSARLWHRADEAYESHEVSRANEGAVERETHRETYGSLDTEEVLRRSDDATPIEGRELLRTPPEMIGDVGTRVKPTLELDENVANAHPADEEERLRSEARA
jgi:hypothetical protein